MATTKEFAAFVCDCFRLAPKVTCRKMFGEYGLYCAGKFFAVLCDNRLFVKPTEPGKQIAPDAPLETPYPGAKPMLHIENLEDPEFLCALAVATCAALPSPKKKKAQQSD